MYYVVRVGKAMGPLQTACEVQSKEKNMNEKWSRRRRQVNTLVVRRIAYAINTAAQIREASWVNSEQFGRSRYKKTFAQAVDEAIDDPRLAQLVYLLTAVSWNDALDWAQDMLAPDEPNS
jgi:hypothetical protein